MVKNEVILGERLMCDLEMILNGGFAPLTGFLNKTDYENVLKNMRLVNGKLWSMPITLPITLEQAEEFKTQDKIILKDLTGLPIAEMDISSPDSIYTYSWQDEAKAVFGTDDDLHPYTSILKSQWEGGKTHYVGGVVKQLRNIPKYDFEDYRLSPEETKEYFKNNGWDKVIGFQTRNPMHRSHYELTQYALRKAGEGAKVLLHPVVGVTQPGDVNYHTRVRCYIELMKYYPENTAKLSLLPLSMRMAGPREAVWHAQIRKNYGCTHFVVGRDHAGPSFKTKEGKSFFGPYDAQDLLMSHAEEIGIKLITSKLIVYATPKDGGESIYSPIDELDVEKYNINKISGTQQRQILASGEELPQWFTFPDVYKVLRDEFKLPNQKGLCLYFVGLSGSGKTTLARLMEKKLRELYPNKKVTYLDGDIVRTNLSKGLGFSKTDRSLNVRRIGYVASLVVKHGGLCVTANIAPYAEDRKVNHELISAQGNMVQIWVNTPLEECEKRDIKGLYKLARSGVIKQFTGISDPFEEPDDSDLIVDGTKDIEEIGQEIIQYLKEKKYC